MQLRKVCCHPFLFPGTEDDPDETPLEELTAASGKLLVLEKLLDQLRAAGHRVCLFSQFTAVLNILEDFVRLRLYPYCRLDGSTNRVQRTVDIASFNAPNSPYFMFLMSTRAGGLGINLQTGILPPRCFSPAFPRLFRAVRLPGTKREKGETRRKMNVNRARHGREMAVLK